jgi:hypothetical protein
LPDICFRSTLEKRGLTRSASAPSAEVPHETAEDSSQADVAYYRSRSRRRFLVLYAAGATHTGSDRGELDQNESGTTRTPTPTPGDAPAGALVSPTENTLSTCPTVASSCQARRAR